MRADQRRRLCRILRRAGRPDVADPAGLSFSEAAAIPETFFTVWANVFQLGKLQPGESILVHGGASGIGTTAVLLCHALGMTVYATVGQDEKIAALRPYATAINYKTDDFAEKSAS
ncbi:Quinone oxidoreductase [Klebsiella pneumoniae]|uniref:Quinone oxidoreductase n=1 Tax=Klebsiella pneumoniae TaxID=573 RepID=A0A378CBG2_KLEPN|nr:Quinone oxidoreductase [Klebsiella pneumoniae]